MHRCMHACTHAACVQVKTSRIFLRDVTPVPPLALLLFGGPLRVLHGEGAVLVSGWLRVACPAQTAVLVKQLRQALEKVLEGKVARAGTGAMVQAATDEAVVSMIVKLLNEDAARSAALA